MGCSPKKCRSCGGVFKACQLHGGLCTTCRNNKETPCYYTTDIVNFFLGKLQCIKDGNKNVAIGLTEPELDALIAGLSVETQDVCTKESSIKEAQALLLKINAAEC